MGETFQCRECGAAIPADSPGGFCGPCLLTLGLQPGTAADPGVTDSLISTVRSPILPTEKAGDLIGHYRLLQEIGHGGCGVVYMAEQEEPVRRRVALKVIKLGMDTKQVVARFEAERQALALMDHPNIAKVLDAGATETGRPYFVMELVGGIKITDYCDLYEVPVEKRMRLFIQVCQAIQHAHQKGIIHRDIKPSNVLVSDHDGVPVTKVIDFGIAKATQGRLTDLTLFTAFEQFLGTPAYMSPEQAQLGSLDVDTRSDIYSLGVLLFELLTGTTPFDTKQLLAAGLDEMRRTIREVQPVKPSTRLSRTQSTSPAAGSLLTRHSSLFNDLDWIVMKCLEKDRARRYDTAKGLAMDIERYLNGEPVVARPPSRLYEFQKTVRRHKVGFAAATSIMIVLVAAATISTWQAIRIAALQRSEAEQRNVAVDAAANLRRNLYAADMNLVNQAYAAGDFGAVRELLSHHLPGPGQPDLRGFEWHYFQARSDGDQLYTFGGFSNSVKAVCLSADGTRLAAGSYDHRICIWDLPGRTLEQSFDGGGPIEDVEFTPDGRWLVFSRGAGSLMFRELKTGRAEVLVETNVARMAISPAGRLVAFTRGNIVGGGVIEVSTNDPVVKVWDYETRQLVFSSSQLSSSLRFSANGRMLGVVGADHQVRVWSIPGGELLGIFGPVSVRSPLAFSTDCRQIATGDDVGEVRVWNLRDGRLVRQHRAHDATIWDVAYANGLLVTASTDQSVRIWDPSTTDERTVLRGHRGEVWRIAVSADGKTLFTGGKDNTVRMWSTDRPAGNQVPTRDIRFWNWPVFSDDGEFLATSERTSVNIRRTGDGSVVGTLPMAWRAIGFTSGGSGLITLGATNEIMFWNWKGDASRPTRTIGTGLPDARAHALNVRLGLLALGFKDGRIRLWDIQRGTELRAWRGHPGAITSLAIDPEGRYLASGCESSEEPVKLWNLPDGSPKPGLTGHTLGVFGVAFSPDGRLLASASIDDTCQLWDPDHGTLTAQFPGHKGGAFSVSFSPDNRTLLVGMGYGRVKMWNLATQRDIGGIDVESGAVFFAGFAPGNNAFATVSFDGSRNSCSLCLARASAVQSTAW